MQTTTLLDVVEYESALNHFGACRDAVDWSQGKTQQEAWDQSERGDWMLCWAGWNSGPIDSDDRKRLVLSACECARLALSDVEDGEDRPLKAIETAERWARGEDVAIDEVRSAATAAYAAANAAANAAYAAATAAYAAAATAYAAAATAYAAYAAAAAYAANATAAAAYAANAARIKRLSECADIVRKHYPESPAFVREPT